MIKALCVALLFTTSATCMAAEQIALSLRQREEKGEVVLDILVSNVSTSSVQIVSEGIAPPWSVWAWFKWEIDKKPAQYSENVAGIPDIRRVWEVPPEGTILWASIPLRSLQHVVRNESGQRELRSVIQDKERHVVTIGPSDRWKDITVRQGTLEVGNSGNTDRDRTTSSLRGPSLPTGRTDRVSGESAAQEQD